MKSKYHKLVYTWKYEPKDLFQGKHNLVIEPYTIIINEGKVITEVYNTTAKDHHSIIQDHVENYFRAATIISGLGYTIDRDYSINAFDENGKILPIVFPIPEINTTRGVSIRIGEALKDEEKLQLIEEEKILGEFFAKYYHAENSIIRFIYESYKASLTEERFPFFCMTSKKQC